jgi:hypothetical protein
LVSVLAPLPQGVQLNFFALGFHRAANKKHKPGCLCLLFIALMFNPRLLIAGRGLNLNGGS